MIQIHQMEFKIISHPFSEKAAKKRAATRKRLETDYVDLLLIHFPGTNDAIQSPGRNRLQREETWRQLEAAKANGQAWRGKNVFTTCKDTLKYR